MLSISDYHLGEFFERAFGKLHCEFGGAKDGAAMPAFYGIPLQRWGLAAIPPVKSQP
jgi:hypothetical protein